LLHHTKNRIIEEDLAVIANSDLAWSDFAGKVVLISGANGFLPAYMVETLLYLNAQKLSQPVKVIALVRNLERAEARFATYSNDANLKFLVQDVCAPVKVDGPVDYVIHAASQASPKYYGVDPVGTLSANVLGTHRLLELARDKRAKGFLFFSSGEVYGHVDPAHIPTAEDAYGYVDPTDVRSCYAEGKRLGETMCICWTHQYQVPTKIVRPFHTYGPGMRLDDGRVFADFVADILNERDIVMKSDGTTVRAFCYLSDAVRGFFTVLLKGRVGHAYNIGNDRGEVSVQELARILVGLFPEKQLKVITCVSAQAPGYLKSAIMRTCPDISKARQLGWDPIISVADGFRRTIGSFA